MVLNIHVFILIALIPGVSIAGPIDPPAGPIESTMKTLDEVEPRIAINQDNTPGDADSGFRISEPGSYYLPQNYTVIGFLNPVDAIEIASSNVTIDLNGFTLTGGTGSRDGVSMEDMYRDITIKNGTFRGFGNHALHFGSDATEIVLADLYLTGNGGSGVFGNNDARVSARRVIAQGNEGKGIDVGSDSVLADCLAIGNAGVGIEVSRGSRVVDCIATGNSVGISAFESVVSGAVAENNAGNGIDSSGGIVRDSVARLNFGNGFELSSSAHAIACRADGNAASGFNLNLNSNVSDSVASANDEAGIKATSRCAVHNNVVHGDFGGTPGYGIWLTSDRNDVVDNTVYGGNTGYRVDAGFNFIARNTARNSSWSVVAANHCLVVNAVNAPAISGQSGGASPGSTDPNANYSY